MSNEFYILKSKIESKLYIFEEALKNRYEGMRLLLLSSGNIELENFSKQVLIEFNEIKPTKPVTAEDYLFNENKNKETIEKDI